VAATVLAALLTAAVVGAAVVAGPLDSIVTLTLVAAAPFAPQAASRAVAPPATRRPRT